MWPPTLAELKVDANIPADDVRDDERLQQVLAAAAAYVARVRGGEFNFGDGSGAGLPEVPDDVRLGTIRLAYRWHVRRRSPDALIQMAELGASRVPGIDPDIERLLGVGRYRGPVVA